MSEPKLTEREAIKLLVQWLPSGHTYMPRFAPAGWWENDLRSVTRAGYWTEFEVKLTRQDFLADKAKSSKRWEGEYPNMVEVVENKHELLATTERGPARFYYAVVEGVASAVDIPPWAGLLEFKWAKYDYQRGGEEKGRWMVEEVKKAALRHRNKADTLVNQIYRAAWYRGIGKLL